MSFQKIKKFQMCKDKVCKAKLFILKIKRAFAKTGDAKLGHVRKILRETSPTVKSALLDYS